MDRSKYAAAQHLGMGDADGANVLSMFAYSERLGCWVRYVMLMLYGREDFRALWRAGDVFGWWWTGMSGTRVCDTGVLLG